MKLEQKTESFECPRSTKTTFLGVVVSSDFLKIPYVKVIALVSLNNLATVISATLHASSKAFLSLNN